MCVECVVSCFLVVLFVCFVFGLCSVCVRVFGYVCVVCIVFLNFCLYISCVCVCVVFVYVV